MKSINEFVFGHAAVFDLVTNRIYFWNFRPVTHISLNSLSFAEKRGFVKDA